MKEYLDLESVNLKSHVRNEYSSKWLLKTFGNKTLSNITPEDVTDYKIQRMAIIARSCLPKN
ncbi:MAG: hypothetical protein WCQ99_07810 [Pseudomonadota bacterium]